MKNLTDLKPTQLLRLIAQMLLNFFGNEDEIIPEALTFDDVLMKPKFSNILPNEQISTRTKLTKNIEINAPIISAAMDTVTGPDMCKKVAHNGGIGILHRNCSVEEQVLSVEHVKRHQSHMVVKPFTFRKNQQLKDAIKVYEEFRFTTFPITDERNQLLGLISERHVRDYANEPEILLESIMIPFEKLFVAYDNTSLDDAYAIMKKEGKKRLPIIKSNEDRTLIGLYFKKDIENKNLYPEMATDSKGRLLVGAAIGVADAGFKRAEALIAAGVDVLVIDTAQGHSIGVIEITKRIKAAYPQMQVIAGNVVTEDGAQALIDAGADGIKVGVGPGAICITRDQTGAGMPQLSAIRDVARVCKAAGVPVIADGGIKKPGDMVKAIAAGANTVMMGSVFSGTDEAPGDIIEGKFKIYRGMGSPEAMKNGNADDRYGEKVKSRVAEGVSGKVLLKGSVQRIIDEYIGALTQAMRTYQGARTIAELQHKPRWVKQTPQGKVESGIRDLILN